MASIARGCVLVSAALACGPAVETPSDDSTGTSGAAQDTSAGVGSTGVTPPDTGIVDPTFSDGGSSTGPTEPLPPGGLGPWGYSFEVFDGFEAAAIVLADFDGDAHVDVFVQGPIAGTDALLQVHSGAGDGLTFAAGRPSVVPWFEVPIPGDFDGDGSLDVVAVDASNHDVFHAALNVGGTFPQSIQSVGDHLFTGSGLAAIDADDDGAQDLFIAGGHSMGGFVYRSDGAGAFAFQYAVAGPACYFSAMVAADFDGDGVTQVAGTGSCNSIPEVLPLVTYRVVDGMLAVDQMFFEGPGVVELGDLVTLDVDLDGDLDLVTGSWPTGLTIVSGDPMTGFATPFGLPYAWEHTAHRLVPVLLAVDGAPAFVLGSENDEYAIAEQAMGGELITSAVDLEGRVVGAADFNEDGRTDVAVLVNETEAFGTLAIWLSQ